MKPKQSLPVLVFLFAFATLLAMPQTAVADKKCKSVKYCFDPSWGCVPCRYIKKVALMDKSIKSGTVGLNNTKKKAAALKASIAKQMRALKSLQKKMAKQHKAQQRRITARRRYRRRIRRRYRRSRR